MIEIPADLQRLPLPPMPLVMERALGYQREARLVVFYWNPGGDDVCWDDGQISTEGVWQNYLLFVEHPAISAALAGYDFGSSEAPARDGLLLDRETRTLYAGPLASARQAVRDQHGPQLSLQDWADREGISLAEAETRQREAIESWLAAFHTNQAELSAHPHALDAEIAERMRIAEANQILLQQALDALPVVELPASPKWMTLHRTRCGLCQTIIGNQPQVAQERKQLIRQHLVERHQLNEADWSQAQWTVADDGTRRWQTPQQTLLVVEPPHVWIQIPDLPGDSLATQVRRSMVEACRHHYAGIFDQLALGIWCGIGKRALLHRVQQVAGTMQSLTASMLDYTLDSLTSSFHHWQEEEGSAHLRE